MSDGHSSTGVLLERICLPSPEQVLCSSPHAHLFVDLLVDTSSPVLQFAALRLGKRITSLQRKKSEKEGKQRGEAHSANLSISI